MIRNAIKGLFTPICFWSENGADNLQTDATFKANSGHPGAPMGLAPAAHVLFNKFMNFNPSNPEWPNRDRFVLSYVFL